MQCHRHWVSLLAASVGCHHHAEGTKGPPWGHCTEAGNTMTSSRTSRGKWGYGITVPHPHSWGHPHVTLRVSHARVGDIPTPHARVEDTPSVSHHEVGDTCVTPVVSQPKVGDTPQGTSSVSTPTDHHCSHGVGVTTLTFLIKFSFLITADWGCPPPAPICE